MVRKLPHVLSSILLMSGNRKSIIVEEGRRIRAIGSIHESRVTCFVAPLSPRRTSTKRHHTNAHHSFIYIPSSRPSDSKQPHFLLTLHDPVNVMSKEETPSLYILYGSATGNAEQIAKDLAATTRAPNNRDCHYLLPSFVNRWTSLKSIPTLG